MEASGAAVGDRFLVVVDDTDPDTVHLHRIRDSYAGSLKTVYGDPAAYLENERGSWERRGGDPA